MTLEFVQVADVGPYDYPTDDLTTPVGYAYRVEVQVTNGDQVSTTESNLITTPTGDVLWFTDCGAPIS